jgi:hypothetical protein
VRCVLVGVHLEGQSHAVLLGYRRELLHRVGGDRDLHTRDREPELRGRLDLTTHVIDELVLAQHPIAMDADVGVDRERRGDEAGLVDEVAEPARERVVDVGEPAEARESDDLEAGAVAVGRDLADEALEVVLATVEGAREAVERDPLDGRAEGGHTATAFRACILLLSCSSMWSTSSAPMMM